MNTNPKRDRGRDSGAAQSPDAESLWPLVERADDIEPERYRDGDEG